MISDRCSMAPLVEARRDGRLAPRDVASLDRHLAACAACRSLDEDLGKISDHLRAKIAPASPLEHHRARVALLRRAADQAPRPADRPWPIRAIAVAATLAAIVLGVWIASTPRRSSPLDPPRIASTTPNPRTETTVHPEAGARFSRTTEAGLDLVTLTSGAINVGVRPLAAGERFIVRTDDAEVEVRGTLFRVEADDGHIVSVTVTEGKVEVRSRGTAALVPAGGAWHAAPPPPSSSEIASPPLAPNDSPKSAPTDLPKAALPDSPKAAPPDLAKRAPARDVAGGGAGEGTGPRAAGGDAARRGSIPSSPPPESAPPAPPSKQFAEALQSMERGDYSGAADRLDAFHAQNPGDTRAEEAAYLRAIALQRAGRAADAAEAARRYLARYPNGSFRREATAIATPR